MKRMSLPELDGGALVTMEPLTESTTTAVDWQHCVPTLSGRLVTLREVQLDDAQALIDVLTSDAVARFISPAPASVDSFLRFIEWAQHERARGTYVCFAVVPHGQSTPVGLFQIRQLEPGFATAEWGFALGSAVWGTGIFEDGARLAVDFAFDAIGVHRLEARAAIINGRGNGALRKIGAVQEAVLRRSFLCQGEYVDQTLWSILDSDWRETRAVWGPKVLVH
jgi:RimJ/RimL family protein N-acetyltransferase